MIKLPIRSLISDNVIQFKNKNNFELNDVKENRLDSNLPKLYSLQEFCDYFGISRNTAYELINTKKLKAKKVGRAYKITKVAIDNFIKTLES
jgi:excisionase family DNA binding protein